MEIESGFAPEISEGLAKLGHKVGRTNGPMGGAQAIWLDWKNGTLIGASDPRKDGCTIGY